MDLKKQIDIIYTFTKNKIDPNKSFRKIVNIFYLNQIY